MERVLGFADEDESQTSMIVERRQKYFSLPDLSIDRMWLGLEKGPKLPSDVPITEFYFKKTNGLHGPICAPTEC
jgi:hypothetical protein